MHSPDDDLLRNAFDEIRHVDRERTPSFGRLWRQTSPRPARRFASAFAALAILIIVATTSALLLRRTFKMRPDPINAINERSFVVGSGLKWKGPTDFLLVTPGSELGSTVPQFPSPVPHYSLKGNAK